ncbi:MAG: DUF3857 domain-containing protein [Terracidiphilus sp.]|jgi:hypothetical protein
MRDGIMRRFILLCGTAVLSAVMWTPRALLAQLQEPTKDELRMTADERAPGASAVYLYREDVTDQAARTRTFYERIKVLTEKGKELATVEMPYDAASEKVEIEARTIHADGTIIPMVEKPADVLDYKTRRLELDKLVFTLPSVEVGSILEYRIKVTYPISPELPTWEIQQTYFIHKAHYAFKPIGPWGIGYGSRIGGPIKVAHDAKGTCTLDLTDIPALPDDDWMPPLNTFTWRVWFYSTTFPTPQAFWDQAERNWAEFVREYTKTTSTLKSAAAGMVGRNDTETQKAQKIYSAVMKLENTDFTREKSAVERKKEKIKDVHNAQDVWREQGGNSDELALLYVALCRAAGLDMDPMRVTDRSQSIFDYGVLSARQFDDYIAVGKLDGKEVYSDPGEKFCPFGMLQWRHTLTSGFRPTANRSATIVRTPGTSDESNHVERVADLTVDEAGDVKGQVRIILSGQDALRWRQIAILSDESEVKKQFNEWIEQYLPEGVQGDFDHFLGLEDYNVNLLGFVRITGSLGTTTGKHMFLPGMFFESKGKHPFVAQEKRTISVDVQYARSENDDVTYRLPASFKVESSPEASYVEWADHAKLSITTTVDGDGVHLTRSLANNYTIVDPKDYGDLHEFYQKLAVADQQQVVLVRAATGQ